MKYNFIRVNKQDDNYYIYAQSSAGLYKTAKDEYIDIRTGEVLTLFELTGKLYRWLALSDQQETILSYIIRHGSITSYEAYIHLNIVALTTRISEMRTKGLPIQSETVRYTTTDGTHKHYNKYYLWKDDSQLQIKEVY